METEEPQNAQEILGDARRRVADEPHPVPSQVVDSADRIVHRAVAVDRERVDGEVAALGVLLPAAAELDPRLAPERLDVLAQRRDFEADAVDDDRHRAVLESGRHRLEAGRLRAPRHFGRERGRGDVDVARRMPEQHVAHRPADHARLLAVTIERRQQLRQRTVPQPPRLAQARRFAHRFIAPGTNFPFSMCAGS